MGWQERERETFDLTSLHLRISILFSLSSFFQISQPLRFVPDICTNIVRSKLEKLKRKKPRIFAKQSTPDASSRPGEPKKRNERRHVSHDEYRRIDLVRRPQFPTIRRSFLSTAYSCNEIINFGKVGSVGQARAIALCAFSSPLLEI